MKFIILLSCISIPALAVGPEVYLYENFDPLDGSYSAKKISRMESPLELEKYLIDGAAACFNGSYDGVKTLVHKMAMTYNFEHGDLASFTVDSQTINRKLSKLKFAFHMKSGATWTWDQVKPCSN